MARFRGRFRFGRKDKRYGGSSYTRKEPEPKPVQSNSVNRIGASDSSFLDSVSTVYYRWPETHPLFQSVNNKPTGKTGRISSLQNICARVVAENSTNLTTEALQLMPKGCVKLIWNQILVSHNDTFELFVMFAKFLVDIGELRCHSAHLSTNNELIRLRNSYLKNCLLPMKNHRIENLLGNIRIDYLQIYLNSLKLDASIFLDFSAVSKIFKTEDYLFVFKIRNLAGLDLSNHLSLDDRIFSFLKIAIRDGMLPKLRILRLENCRNVSRSSIESLVSMKNNRLSLIVCDHMFTSTFGDKLTSKTKNLPGTAIRGTQWAAYAQTWDKGRLLMRLPLPFQYQQLHTEFKDMVPDTTGGLEEVLLDFMVHDLIYELGYDSSISHYVERKRIHNRERNTNCTLLMIDTNLDVKPVIEQEKEKKEIKQIGVFSTVPPSKRKGIVKKRLKPKIKGSRMEDFF